MGQREGVEATDLREAITGADGGRDVAAGRVDELCEATGCRDFESAFVRLAFCDAVPAAGAPGEGRDAGGGQR